jgi:hypothetical protein
LSYAISRLCASRNHDQPLESDDLNLVILEDVEIMTIDEIKDEIEVLTAEKLKLQEQIQILIQNNIDELAIQAIQDKIENIEKEIGILHNDIKQALEIELKAKIEELINEFKDYFQMFINDERLNNDLDKIRFMDRLIDVISQEKQAIIVAQQLINYNKIVTNVEVISDRKRREGVTKNFVDAICEVIKKLQSIDVLIDLNLSSNGRNLICKKAGELFLYYDYDGSNKYYNHSKIKITYSNGESKVYYINTHSDNARKKTILEQIKNRLGVDINIDEIIK